MDTERKPVEGSLTEWTLEQRRSRLQREVRKYVSRGFHVVSQTDTTAQLVKPKSFSLLWAIFWLLMLIVGLAIYVLYYIAKRDETIYLEVDERGRVSRRR